MAAITHLRFTGQIPTRSPIILAMLLLGLLGLIPLGVAAFELGRNPSSPNRTILIAGFVGLLLSFMLGILAMLIVGIGTLLIGRGTRAAGAGQAAYLVSGAVILSFPFLMLGLFYMASLST